IAGIEYADTKSFRSTLEGVEEHALALIMHEVGLLEEAAVVEHSFIPPPRIFQQAEGAEVALAFRDPGWKENRMTDRKRRLFGIDIHRRHVQLDGRRNTSQADAHDAGHRAASLPERNFDPRRK